MKLFSELESIKFSEFVKWLDSEDYLHTSETFRCCESCSPEYMIEAGYYGKDKSLVELINLYLDAFERWNK